MWQEAQAAQLFDYLPIRENKKRRKKTKRLSVSIKPPASPTLSPPEVGGTPSPPLHHTSASSHLCFITPLHGIWSSWSSVYQTDTNRTEPKPPRVRAWGLKEPFLNWFVLDIVSWRHNKHSADIWTAPHICQPWNWKQVTAELLLIPPVVENTYFHAWLMRCINQSGLSTDTSKLLVLFFLA